MDENEEVVDLEIQTKKEIKRTVNKLTSGVFVYQLIMIIVMFGEIIIRAVSIILTTKDEAKADALMNKMVDSISKSGISYLIAIFLGTLFLFWYFRKLQIKEVLFQSNAKMSYKSFFMILTVFMSVQVIFSLLGSGVETGLNQFGYSILSEINSASSRSTTVSMFLYASIFGPITEEIVFRGFLMRGLQKFGSRFAIIVSAVVFGAYHGNLIQGIFATMVGLVLGYMAMEYSLKWSIILHIFNNFIFGDLFSLLVSGFSDTVQTVLTYTMEGAFFLGAIIVLFRKRNAIRNYLKDHHTEKGFYLYAFTAVWMIIYLVIQIAMGLSGIERI